MNTHKVGPYELKFTGRRTWKAEVRKGGKLVCVAPVTWTKGWGKAKDGGLVPLEVWFTDGTDRQEHQLRKEPFMAVVAKAHDYGQLPHKFAEFTAVVLVLATGKDLSEESIGTLIIERLA